MLGRFGIVVAAAGSLCLIASSVPAQFPPVTDPNKDEAKCESNAGKTLGKFTGQKAKCISKCIKTGRKTSGPYTGCFGPGFSDPATNACIKDPLKGAEAKAAASIVKKCPDCPECYDPNVCTDSSSTNPFVSNTESLIDPFGNLVFCTEAAGMTPTKDEGKCEDSVAKALAKFVASKTKCYDKCTKNELKGKIAPGSCMPPSPSDPATNACIFDPLKGAEAKTAAAIDKKCVVTPACYGGQTGMGWVTLVENIQDTQVPIIACGSPSGAFVQ